MSSESDSEVDSKKHETLINDVLNLDAKQRVSRPTRSEPTAQISEYNLIKSVGDSDDTVRLHDLTKSLKARAVGVELRKSVKRTEVKSKTLLKPLEKPQADRIRRSTAYDSTKTQLDRWEPVVTSNRVSTNLSFPLKDLNFHKNQTGNITSDWVLKSNLEKELEKLEPKEEVIQVETESLPTLTLREMMERRKELAKLRKYQSYKEIKAKQQNKIKSKKFRRIQRKEKSKEQMKEFELLQKTNPEQALKKLEEIEMARAEERASLRHKSTGKWARNQQIRAKYDKESRKVLAEQLAISKDLMQKQQDNISSESEDDEGNDDQAINNQDGDNPWTNKIKPSKEVEEFISTYTRFWEEKNLKNSEKPINHDKSLKSILKSQPSKVNKLNTAKILPEKIANVKPVSLNSSVPDVLTYDDNEEIADRTGIITEAFEDTDIMEEFEQDKKNEVDKDKPKDIDLTLPGWGSWGGKDLPVPKRKKKRLIIKVPKEVPRKDMNKGHLIINESGNDKLKSHLVSEVPFPFKTVKDFEASVRAPIGSLPIRELNILTNHLLCAPSHTAKELSASIKHQRRINLPRKNFIWRLSLAPRIFLLKSGCDINSLLQDLVIAHEPSTDASKLNIKAVLLNNGNELPFVPFGQAVYIKKTCYNQMQLLVRMNIATMAERSMVA
ncbi:hypothetical protein Trydic_g3278 [Trypoxylus dichotomus]